MRNDQSASEVKIKFKTREGFWHKIDEFPDESKNGRKKSKNPKPNPNHVGTFLKDLLRTVSRRWTVELRHFLPFKRLESVFRDFRP